jgi:hypothetical protein
MLLRPLLQPKRNMGKTTPAGPLDSKYLKYLGFNLVAEADPTNRPFYAA